MSNEKVNLSQATEFLLRGNVTLNVYPASLETLSLLAPKLDEMNKLSKSTDMKKQMDLFLDVVYELVKDDNDVKKTDLKKALTVEAGVKIMQKALGSFGNMLG
jgi:hypothetical protein